MAERNFIENQQVSNNFVSQCSLTPLHGGLPVKSVGLLLEKHKS